MKDYSFHIARSHLTTKRTSKKIIPPTKTADKKREEEKKKKEEILYLPLKTLRIPREVLKYRRLPLEQGKAIKEENETMIKYTREDSISKTSLYFPQDIRKEFMPSLPMMKKIFWGMLSFCFELGDSKIELTAKEMLLRLGYDEKTIHRGGKIFKLLRGSFWGLAMGTFRYTDKKEGDNHEAFGGSFITLYEKGWGKRMKYRLRVNEELLQNIDLKNKEVTGQYIKAYLPELVSREGSYYERNLKEYFLEVNQMPEFRIHGQKLLHAAGIAGKEQERKALREEILQLALRILKDRGYKITGIAKKEDSKDFRDWLYTFKLTRAKKSEQTPDRNFDQIY